MLYGVNIKNTKNRTTHGILEFNTTKRKIKLTNKERLEFDEFLKRKIIEYGGNVPF